MMEANKDDFELDTGLFELRQKYLEMKKDRKRSQKDADTLANKLKLLGHEEEKVQKREEIEKKSQEEMDKIRQDFLLEKELVNQMKIAKEKELYYNKQMITLMRENITTALANTKLQVAQKNKNELDKMKLKRKENEQLVKVNKTEHVMEKKAIVEQVKFQKMTCEEKKKREEVNITWETNI